MPHYLWKSFLNNWAKVFCWQKSLHWLLTVKNAQAFMKILFVTFWLGFAKSLKKLYVGMYTKMAEFPNKNIDYGWQWPFRYWPASLNERKRTLLPFKLTLGNLQTKKHASSSWKCTWSRIAKCVNWIVELGFLKIEFTIHIHSPTDLSYNLQLNIQY